MRNLLSTIALVLVGFSAVTHGDATVSAVDQNLLGAWRSAVPVGSANGIDYFIAASFKADATADMSLICHRANGQELEAVVTVPYSAENGKVQILGEGSSSIDKDGYNCHVTIERGTTLYSIQGDTLVVTAENGQTLNMTRRN